MQDGRLSRRRALGVGAGALVSSIAGCTGGSGEPEGESTQNGDEGGENEGDTNGNSLGTRPGSAGLDSQPYLGADPESASPVIVAFEDPSCTTCRRFEEQTLPTLKRELLETEKAAFVFRGIGIIYDWGEPAAKALEATLEHSESAHWALKDHYYADQGAFDVDNTLQRTRSFLDDETEVDGGAVVEAVEMGSADDAYGVDLDASKAADVTATPTFLLFNEGQYVTSAVGAVSYEVFANALEVE